MNTFLDNIQQQWQQQKIALQSKALKAWQTHVEPKYRALEDREQRIVLLAAIILPLTILIFGVLLPVADKNTKLHADIKAFSSQVAEAEQLADQLASNPKSQNASKPSGNNMLTQVDKIARQTGVRSFVTRLRPQQIMGKTTSLQAQIKNVPYDKVVAFLSELAQQQLPLSQIKIQAASPGLVHVQAVIGG